jgi:hypothetical protein
MMMTMTAVAAFALAMGFAHADLGDSNQVSACKYTPVSHDPNFDLVGKDH